MDNIPSPPPGADPQAPGSPRPLPELLTLPRVLLTVLAALVFGLTAGVPSDPPGAEDMRAGDRHMSALEYSAAVEAYSRANMVWPDRPAVLLRLGRALIERHRWDEAAHVLARVPAQATESAEALAGRAQAATGLDRMWEARALWQEAVARSDSVRMAYGEWLWAHPQPDAALTHLELAEEQYRIVLRLDPESSLASYRMGLLLVERDRARASEYLSAAARGPDSSMSERARAILAVLPVGGVASAAQLNLLGLALLQVDEPELSRSVFVAASRVDPASPVALAYLGYIAVLGGDPTGARETLNHALQFAPDYGLARYFLGELEESQGRMPEARAQYIQVTQVDPGNAGALAAVARTYQKEGDLASTEQWMTAAVEAAPDNAGIRLALARLYIDRLVGVDTHGVPVARRAVELAPQSAEAHDILGWALFVSGEAADGQAEIEQAIRLDPRLAQARYHLGRLLAATGRADDARYQLTRAMDLDPGGEWEARAATGIKELR